MFAATIEGLETCFSNACQVKGTHREELKQRDIGKVAHAFVGGHAIVLSAGMQLLRDLVPHRQERDVLGNGSRNTSSVKTVTASSGSINDFPSAMPSSTGMVTNGFDL